MRRRKKANPPGLMNRDWKSEGGRGEKKKRNKSEGWTEEGRSAELIRLFFFWLGEKHDIDIGKSWR